MGGAFYIVVALLLMAYALYTGATYDCQKGCHRAFEPVCGEDGRTYSNDCVAVCQEVHVNRAGPCPGEHLLTPVNEHVVTGEEKDPASPTSSSAGPLTNQHLHAFRTEGFRYAGQMRFTGDMPRKRHTQQEQLQQQSVAAAAAAAGLGHGLGLGLDSRLYQQGSPQAVRITRDGHLYFADADENVDRVLDLLIQHHGAAADAEQNQQSAEPVHALLHSLQQWRSYRGSRRGGSGTSKWARHTVVAATRGPAEHVLQPGLDSSAAAGFAAEGGASAAALGADKWDSSTRQQQQQEAEENVSEEAEDAGDGLPSGRWASQLGGPRSDRDKWRQTQTQQRSEGEKKGGGGGRGMTVHRQARRRLGIFDTDDRIDCPRMPTYPFTAVGQINVRDTSGNYVCSGALVGPDVVLTAGHCVYSRAAQAFYKELDFAPSRYRTLDGQVFNPFGVIRWSYVTLYQGYSSPTTPDPNVQDVAVITLSERIGSQAGWMGVLEPCNPYAPTRYVALTAGYPADQAAGSCKTTQCVVIQEPCTDGYLYHKCDTASGQSGSPMYMMAMTAGRKMGPYIRGVHNIEWVQEASDGSTSSYINSAVSITPDHYRSILAWIGLSFTTNGTTPMGPELPPVGYTSQISSGGLR